MENKLSEAVLIPPEGSEVASEVPAKKVEKIKSETLAVPAPEINEKISNITNGFSEKSELVDNGKFNSQKLEEKAQKAQEALEKEEKARKELEALNSKLLAEKTALLDSLSGEKGALQDYQEKCAKLTAQKNDLDNQLRVSIFFNFFNYLNEWQYLKLGY